MSHPFQKGVGAVMSHPKRGGGDRDESSKEGWEGRNESLKEVGEP